MSRFRFFNSNRLEQLLDQLARVVGEPLDSPLTPEVIVVQSPGMQRWLSLRLAERFGVWTNDAQSFPFPNAFIWQCFRAVNGQLPQRSPFDREVLLWRIMLRLPDLLARPEFARLRAYLGAVRDPLKLYQFCSRLADLFDQYIVFRPDLLKGWEQGESDADEPWQAVLWRELTRQVALPHRGGVLEEFLRIAQTSTFPADRLPRRIAIFGIPTLPPMHLAVFQALARHLEVNLFLLNPSREYWGDIVSTREAARRRRQLAFSFDDGDLHLGEGNSLLASLGGLGRDFFRQLLGDVDFEQEFSSFDDPGEDSLLHCLQGDILLLRDRPSRRVPQKAIAADDDSLQVHSCHGPLREMEVLYDQLLDLFERHPDLTPNDVLVMIPDLEGYAPYISAVFEQTGEGSSRIPFRIADRGLRRQSAVAETFLKILALPGSRFGAAQVMDILETPAVLERFELAPADLDLVRRWISQTRIRWGIDAADRARQGLPAYGDNSWREGLRRLLLGYALPEENRLFAGILPQPAVAGGNAHPLGALLDFAETLFQAAAELELPRAPDGWVERLGGLLARFFSSSGEAETDIEMVRAALRRFGEQAAQAGFTEPLPLETVRAHLLGQLEKTAPAQAFLAGGVTFCALLPMRSIPFRVVVLAGMNDGVFPRAERPASFDLMARRPRLGDRSLRKEDRYLFLEALVSARDHLIISYVGQSARDGSIAPPSVLVSELLDAVERGFTHPQHAILAQVVRHHRLQAFHPDYFQGSGPLFSYSRENCEALAARVTGGRQVRPLLTSPLPELPAHAEVNVAELVRFLQHPVRAFLEGRLGIRLGDAQRALPERESLSLDALERYQVVNALVAEHLAEAPAAELYSLYRARGVLPPGQPGAETFRECSAAAATFAAVVRPLREELPHWHDVDLTLGGLHLTGRIARGGVEGPLRFRPGPVRGKDLLDAWVAHLAFCCGGEEVETLVVGRDEIRRLGPVAEAETLLADLLALYREGMCRLLPIYPKSSFVFAQQVAAGKPAESAFAKAIREWEGNQRIPGENLDPWLRFALKGSEPFTGEFEPLALRLYQPLLRALEPGAP